jgi:hypothetical protein
MNLERVNYNRKSIESGEVTYIGRGHRYHNIPRSKWCNPYQVKEHGLEQALKLFREYITSGEGKHLQNELHELKGKKIACHCGIDSPCHGDIIAELFHQLV